MNRDGVELREQCTGDTGQSGPKTVGQNVDLRNIDTDNFSTDSVL